MKNLLLVISLFGIFLSGCQSSYSPVGEWELYVNQNNKHEELMSPKVTLTIHADGKFTVSAAESGRPETKNGVWKQRGKIISFIDDKGEHSFLMDSENKILLENQYLKKFGTQLLYIRKSQVK